MFLSELLLLRQLVLGYIDIKLDLIVVLSERVAHVALKFGDGKV